MIGSPLRASVESHGGRSGQSINKLQKCHRGKLSEIALLPNANVMRYL
jgi:hypothetical protein